MASKEQLRHLVIQQKTHIEKSGDFVERSLFNPVIAALNDNHVIILSHGTPSVDSGLYGNL
ncbi:MAG: hypothetical protein Q8S57_06590 [Methanoregula sp.]|nr:hypothetical protein [Methanoregula sp.]